MTENRLEFLDIELSAYLETASSLQQRTAAKVACFFAIERTGLSAPILNRGLEALAFGNYGDNVLRKELEAFVNYLDEIQWDLQEKMEKGNTNLPNYLTAFHQARAANSLYFALDSNALNAATESIYEADAATEDLASLKQKILEELKAQKADNKDSMSVSETLP